MNIAWPKLFIFFFLFVTYNITAYGRGVKLFYFGGGRGLLSGFALYTICLIGCRASQFIILKDQELLSDYLQQEKIIFTTLTTNTLFNTDTKLLILSGELSRAIGHLHQYLTTEKLAETSLAPLKIKFKQLGTLRKDIASHSNTLLLLQAEQINISANTVKNDLLKSLAIIPFTFIIAAIFIFLITKPLKQLLIKIQRLEQGNFADEVTFKGAHLLILTPRDKNE